MLGNCHKSLKTYQKITTWLTYLVVGVVCVTQSPRWRQLNFHELVTKLASVAYVISGRRIY